MGATTVTVTVTAAAGVGRAGTGPTVAEVCARIGDRKVERFVDPQSGPPIAAALDVVRTAPVATGPSVALFTVSSYEPGVPRLRPWRDLPAEERMAAFTRDVRPLEVLRRMANNPLCQVAIAAGLGGPNAHVVGTAPALAEVLLLAAGALERGAAGEVVVVAYEPRTAPPLTGGDVMPVPGPSDAVAVRLGPPGTAGDAVVLHRRDRPAPGGSPRTALDGLRRIVAATRLAAPAGVELGPWTATVVRPAAGEALAR